MRVMVMLVSATMAARAGELHEAARGCEVDRMRKLLRERAGEKAAALNERDEKGMTPLHVAIEHRRKACVEMLLVAGADRTVRDGQGRTPFEAAERITAMPDRAEILLLFWHAGQPKSAAGTAGPAIGTLEYWAMRRQPEIVKLLLKLGLDPNQKGAKGTTALEDAALKGDLESVRALLERGARPDVVSEAGTQPIHDAALGDNAEVIRELVARGAKVNARTRDEGMTALHIAALMGKMKAVEALMALGADKAIKDAKGRTAEEILRR